MHIMLVNPQADKYSRSVTLPLGLLSIATNLNYHGHTARIYDRTVDKYDIGLEMQRFKPNIVGISLMSHKCVEDALHVSRIAKSMGLMVVWGGPFVTPLADMVLKSTEAVDFISLGEGEQTWLEIADALNTGGNLCDIAGLAYRENGQTKYSAQRDFIDLASLPVLDFSLVCPQKYFQSSFGSKRMLYLYAAKGCPFSCTFCYNALFHKSTYRKRPIEHLLTEIKYLSENCGMDGVYFADELWCTTKSEMKQFCDAVSELKLNLVWNCQTRIGIFDADDFKYMYNAGCRQVFFGIESGSRRMLDYVNKKIDIDKVVKTFDDCRSAGINAISSFIIGIPGETEDDLRQTVELAKKLNSDLCNMNFFMLVMGSQESRRLEESGVYKTPDDLLEFAKKHSHDSLKINFSKIPTKDLRVVRACFMWRSFTAKNLEVDTGKGSFEMKVVSDALKSVVGHGFLGFIRGCWESGNEFLNIFIYSHMSPSIRKKYDL